LTAFLPPDYPLAEEPEGAATPKRQGKQKILLLENINLDAANYLKQAGFEVSLPCLHIVLRADLRSTTSPRPSQRRSSSPSCLPTMPSVSEAKPR
jgi:hypothetical protein